MEITREFFPRPRTGLGLRRGRVPQKGTPCRAPPIVLFSLINGLVSFLGI